MKHTFFYGMLAMTGLLLASGCSNDETLSQAPDPAQINFEGFVNKSTRANDITLSNLKEFSVYGVTLNASDPTAMATLFDGTKVSLEGSAWTYSPLRYWVAGNDYIFSAFAPVATATSTSGDTWTFTPDQTLDATTTITGLGQLTFNNQQANANQDLIYAFAQVKSATATQAPVSFTFNHLLSRVMFTFENTFSSSGSYIEISDVQVADVNASGSINFTDATPAWSVTAGSTFARPFELVTNNGVEFNNQGSAATTWYYFIPANQTYKLTFTVKLYSGSENGDVLAGTFEKICTLPAVDMKQGYSYNFTAEIDENNVSNTPLNPIVFTVTGVEDWEDWADGGNVQFPD